MRAGVDRVQIRAKRLDDDGLLRLSRCAVDAAGAARVFINGRPDVATAVGAAGVQLPEAGLPVDAVRRAFPALAIGASRHDADGVRRAFEDGADFVIVGPVFPTPGKESRALGLDALRRIVESAAGPVHAVGGITPEAAAAVVEQGVRGVAAIAAFLRPGLADTVAAFRSALDR